MEIEVSARIGAMIVRIATALGVDAAELQRLTGFDIALAANPDARIDVELENRLWETATHLSGDPYFGLRAASHLKAGAFDVLDYVIRTAPTLRESLVRLTRYNRLVHSAAVFRVEERGERLRVEHAFAAPGHAPNRHASEFTLASIIVVGGQICNVRVEALAVELPTAPPEHSRAVYEEVFGVLPRFGTAVGALELARTITDHPCPAADPMLSDVILRQADALLVSRPDPAASISNRIRRLLATQLGHGSVTLAMVASELRMSERSLQRRLGDEGVTFEAVVEDLRRELALRYLADPSLAIGEVAYLLGYSEPSAFHRAFKRWTGSTPAEVRARPGASR